MKKILTLAIVALVVPSVALAGKPADPGKSQETHGNSQSASQPAPMVLYVLKGVITSFNGPTDPQNPLTTPSPNGSYSCENGSVTINVRRVNHQRAAFTTLAKAQALPLPQPLSLSLTVCLSKTTKVVVWGRGLVDLTDLGTISLDATGMVKVRYAKNAPKLFDTADGTELAKFLGTGAKQVIVKKPVPASSSS